MRQRLQLIEKAAVSLSLRTLLCEASRHKGTVGNVPIVVARTRGLPIIDAMLSVIADSDGVG